MASSRNPDAPSAAGPAAEPPDSQAPNPSIPPGDPPSPEMEATAEALTREEVIRRRRRRAARLAGVYRRLYWAMAEEVRARHRQYVWDLGRSALEAEQPPPPPGAMVFPVNGEPPRPPPVPRRKKCGFTGCKVRAMAMTRFCHSHILSDPNQALYKPCAYVIKSGVQSGQAVTCGRPIIKSAVPSLCNVHFQRNQKNIAQAYKKVGFNPPPTGKITPRFSLLVAECVRQIQDKRRQSLNAAARHRCPKDEKVFGCLGTRCKLNSCKLCPRAWSGGNVDGGLSCAGECTSEARSGLGHAKSGCRPYLLQCFVLGRPDIDMPSPG